jgi:TonB family protein
VRRKVLPAVVLALASLAGPTFVQAAPQEASAGTASSPERAPQEAMKAYPDSERGLKQLFQDLMELEKTKADAVSSEYYRSFVLPNPKEWFDETYGPDLGPWFSIQYAENGSRLPTLLKNTVVGYMQEKLTEIDVRRYESCNRFADPHEAAILRLVKGKTPLYRVGFFQGRWGRNTWFFAYVEGRFRYTGRPDILRVIRGHEKAKRGSAAPDPLAVTREVQEARLVHQERPSYPDDARAERISGTVRLHGVIETDGTLKELFVVEGACSLADSAMKAVGKWRYSPTLVGGKPVQVETFIDVIFTLTR